MFILEQCPQISLFMSNGCTSHGVFDVISPSAWFHPDSVAFLTDHLQHPQPSILGSIPSGLDHHTITTLVS